MHIKNCRNFLFMVERIPLQFFDKGWEIYQDGKCVTDYLRFYVYDHEEPLTYSECVNIIEKTKDIELYFRKVYHA